MLVCIVCRCMENRVAARYHTMISRLESQGFDRFEVDGLVIFHRRKSSITGRTDTVVGVGYETDIVTGALFEQQDQQVRVWHVNWVFETTGRIWKGALELFSVVFAESADASAVEAAQGPCPKRYGSLSTRALVHGAHGVVEYFEGQRVWGAAVIKSQRRELLNFLAED